MRPSARLFDGTAQAYVGSKERSAYAGIERDYIEFGDPFPCAVQVRSRVLANRGPGEAEVGTIMVYAPIEGAPLLESGMVVKVLTGPEAGRRVRVQDPYRPRNRFQQPRCFQWDGVLPGDA